MTSFRSMPLMAVGIGVLLGTAIAPQTFAAQPSISPSSSPLPNTAVADLFKTLRIIEDVDDLLEGDYLEVSPIEDVLDPINDAIEAVDDTVDEVQDVFDDDSRDTIDDIDDAIDRITHDTDNWYD
jgi:hypothetical protein